MLKNTKTKTAIAAFSKITKALAKQAYDVAKHQNTNHG